MFNRLFLPYGNFDPSKTTWSNIPLNSVASRMDRGDCDPVDFQGKVLGAVPHGITVYGGYLEERSEFLEGTYLTRNHYRLSYHLGVDFWVPAWTPVTLPVEMVLVASFEDKDTDGGWGGVVMALNKENTHLFIFAHLLLPRTFPFAPAGTVIGVVGKTDTNGGWFPHLHIQAVDIWAARSKSAFDDAFTRGDYPAVLKALDGYGFNGPHEMKAFPDPIPLLFGGSLRR